MPDPLVLRVAPRTSVTGRQCPAPAAQPAPFPLQFTPLWSPTRTARCSSPGPRRGKPPTTPPTARQVVRGREGSVHTWRDERARWLCAGLAGGHLPASLLGPGARVLLWGEGATVLPRWASLSWPLLSEPPGGHLCTRPPLRQPVGSGPCPLSTRPPPLPPCRVGPPILLDLSRTVPKWGGVPGTRGQPGQAGGPEAPAVAGRRLRRADLVCHSAGGPVGAAAGQACSRGDQSGVHRDRAGSRRGQAVPAGEGAHT